MFKISHHTLNMSLHYLVKYECQNWRQSEICIVINDQSQDNTAKYLSCDGLLYYKYAIQLLVKDYLKSVNIWQSYRENG